MGLINLNYFSNAACDVVMRIGVFMNLNKLTYSFLFSVIGFFETCALGGALAAESAVSDAVFYDAGSVGQDLARVVYYRLPGGYVREGVANVYLDREFVTALSPGRYTDFCVRPGSYAVTAPFKNDSLFIKGAENVHAIEASGGVTYFLRVNEIGDGVSLLVTEGQALQELKGLERENRLLSRASQTEPCFANEHADNL